MKPAVVIAVAYLLGSVPFGYLIVRASQGADVRETGSGGTGATNVSRKAGKLAGVVTLLLDAVKGAAAVLIALWAFGLFSQPGLAIENAYWWVAAAAVVTIVGHVFPVWLGFRGGKGVATGVGVFLVLAPIAVVLAGVIFLGVVVLTRYVSLGSILAAAAIPFLVLGHHEFLRPVPGLIPHLAAASASAILIIFAHRANIGRLIAGTENKFR